MFFYFYGYPKSNLLLMIKIFHGDKFKIYSDDELISRMLENEDVFTYIYQKHREYCLNFMKSMGAEFEVAIDIYQDATIVLYEKVKVGGFELRCSIQTYLNSICRNQFLAKGKSKYRLTIFIDDFDENIKDWFDDDNNIETEKIERILNGLRIMKDSKGNCYEILRLFFYENYSTDRIAKHFGYTNSDNAKNQKARCQKTLKKLAGSL